MPHQSSPLSTLSAKSMLSVESNAETESSALISRWAGYRILLSCVNTTSSAKKATKLSASGTTAHLYNESLHLLTTQSLTSNEYSEIVAYPQGFDSYERLLSLTLKGNDALNDQRGNVAVRLAHVMRQYRGWSSCHFESGRLCFSHE